ncbi:hypothetical protein MNV49_000961 [Pseudohyphozyma bogoriensis]|nr:hypothetical protein MNV49_000961 [Pseudohyphozyma bogoriensis]
MASFYTRPSYVASWAPGRIFPHRDPSEQEHDLEAVDLATRTRSRDRPTSPTVPPPAATAPRQAPPPMYFPGAEQLARTRTGTLSTNVAYSQTAELRWQTHPTIVEGWWRRILGRPALWWRCLKKDKELLEVDWPEPFGGRRRSPSRPSESGSDDPSSSTSNHVTRSHSLRSAGADSGVAGLDEPPHPLSPLFTTRVQLVNEAIAAALVPTRTWLAFCEILFVLWVVVLIVAIAVCKGQQKPFLEGVEVALVLLFLVVGTLVNSVRMNRWKLTKQLRTYSRDWSPLPTTSSTNQNLMDNFLGEIDHEALACAFYLLSNLSCIDN